MIFKTTSITLVTLFVLGQSSYAIFNDKSKLEHLFNSHTYKSRELSLSVLGGVRYGLTDDLEIGTNVYLDALSYFNLLIKAKLYSDDRLTLAFQTYAIYGMDDGEDVDLFFMPLFFNSTYRLIPGLDLNVGIFDAYARSDFEDSTVSAHPLGVHAGVDYYLSQHHALTLIAGSLMYVTGDFDTSFADVDFSVTGNDLFNEYLVYVSYNYSLVTFNFEFGMFLPVGTDEMGYIPWINLYWRF